VPKRERRDPLELLAPFQTSNKKDYDSDSEGEATVPDTDNTPDPEIDPDDPYLTIP